MDAWAGDNRDLALALVTMGHATLFVLDGQTDHIALYERAARTVVHVASHGSAHRG